MTERFSSGGKSIIRGLSFGDDWDLILGAYILR